MEETPKPRPVPRDASSPIPLPVDDGEQRPMRSTARESAPAPTAQHPRVEAGSERWSSATHPDAVAPAAPATDATPTAVAPRPEERADATERIQEPTLVERVQVQRPGLGKRERRGAVVAGALGLPLVTLGLITLAVPIGAWYVTTVFKSVIMAVAALFATESQVRELDRSITAVDPTAFGNVSFWLIVIGAVLTIGGILLSWLVLRSHGVFHPFLVTLTAVPMALGLSAILQAGAAALAGLVFQLGDGGISAVIANALFALLLFLVAAVAIAVAVGIGVWLWMASVFRATVVTGAPTTAKG
ncbi:hypothetical protein [Agrococcus carbonis]|uniref:Uncharacterized protein n=1 Tax=Agrococcus carbonis TaxID=684552 RepID=A0A1H1NR60_9MICO|nr:hypothetical protein [Agrococcus carbonis]SDS01486.1 hypothetical protein SAMN04489719_1341 [Agrococcus carbonis]